MNWVIDAMGFTDWPAVSAIYEEGIATGNATFETSVPNWEAWSAGRLPVCRLAGRRAGTVLGWAALSPISSRAVYAGVAEVSVYVSAGVRGQGLGEALLHHLTVDSEKHGIWTLQAGIFPENGASLRLHEKFGFREVGLRERIGCREGRWRDVILMERRSKIAGL